LPLPVDATTTPPARAAADISVPIAKPELPVVKPEVPISTTGIDFAHLDGHLEAGRRLGTWCLRYAPADGNDRFGGSVTLLLDEKQRGGLQAGQHVYVDGELVDPQAGGLRPGYRVDTIKFAEH
jgi:hypothetical protein